MSTPAAQISARAASVRSAIVVMSAAGDALGAGYEYGCAALPRDRADIAMIGGGLGGFAPGEWTDDTAMATAILSAAATHADLTSPEALADIAAGFLNWYATFPPDVGGHTSRVLGSAMQQMHADPTQDAGALLTRLARIHARTDPHVSNGGLMRTAPVVLPYLPPAPSGSDLGAPAAAARAAAAVSALTHAEPVSQSACAAWTVLLWAAAHGFPPDSALQLVDDTLAVTGLAHGPVSAVLQAAASGRPSPGTWPNGHVLGCLRDAAGAVLPAWQADPDAQHPGHHAWAVLQAAVACGGDTDTVAAVAGALVGAIWGPAGIPAGLVAHLHGYPGWRAEPDLLRRAHP